MAERRMFAKTIIDSDAFLDMPHSTQLLYFHLNMRADDDGFINNPKNIMRMIGCEDDDLSVLITKKFIIPFESGVVVIKHWKIHNYIAKDRYKETKYKDEKALLTLDENNSYTFCIQDVYKMCTQVSIGKVSIGKASIDNNIPPFEEKSSTGSAKANDIIALKDKELQAKKEKTSKHKYGEYKNVLLKDEELLKLKKDYTNWEDLIKYLDEYIEMKGYKAKSHYLCIKKWVVDAVKKKSKKSNSTIEEWLNE